MNKLRVILAGAALLLTFVAGGQNTRTQETKKAKLEKEIAQIDAQLKANASKTSTAQSDLVLIRKKIANRNELIAESDREIARIGSEIKAKQSEIAIIQGRLDTLSLYYGNLVRNAYKNRDAKVWYMYLLSSESLGQGLRRFGYLRSLSSQMSEQAVKIQETQAQLEVERERLSALKGQAETMRKKVVQERSSLQSEEAEHNRLVDRLHKDRKKYQQQLKEKNQQKEALNRKIADLIRQQQKAAASQAKKGKGGAKTTSTEIDAKLSNEFTANKGRLPWPVEGAIIERFGKHKHPVYQNVDLPHNNGVTLAVKRGAQAKAVFNGTVTQIVVLPGYNQCVLVNHGAYFTLYSKLKSVAVKVGQKVTTGQVVGTVDTIAGEDLFHFELWNGSTPQNPENWLRR